MGRASRLRSLSAMASQLRQRAEVLRAFLEGMSVGFDGLAGRLSFDAVSTADEIAEGLDDLADELADMEGDGDD